MVDLLIDGFGQVLQWQNLIVLALGIILGMVLGAVPGLTSAMAIALIIPFTYALDPVTSIVMLLGAYKGGIYGGSIPAILIGTPGTPAAAATVADGYALARQGKGGKALRMALFASVTADLISDIVLIVVAIHLARFALMFGPAEFTVLMVFALTTVAISSGRSLTKGVISACLGMMVALIGVDPMTGRQRLTFGSLTLAGGLELVPLLIGLMAVSEVLVQVESRMRAAHVAHLPPPAQPSDGRLSLWEYLRHLKTILRSTFIGTIVGVIPGLGPTLGAYIAYNVAHQFATPAEQRLFGKGSLDGVAAAESGNNAVSGANMIPLLGFGVPGDLLAAVIIGAFLLQGIAPGPRIFTESPDVVYGIYAGLIVANLLLLAIALPTLRVFVRLAQVRTSLLFPLVVMFCIVGSYAFNQNIVDVYVMLVFGVLGYVMRKFGFPLSTLIIGFIVTPLLERSFRQSLIFSRGGWDIFFGSSITWVLWGLTALSLGLAVASRIRMARRIGTQVKGQT